jgi:eukaryotic-like serine/threonine-protein kinase
MPRATESVSLPSYVRIGDVLAGKYRIERVLGCGGMGIVVAASHIQLRQTVAIKFLLPGSLRESQLGPRLLREARAAAALKGEHVARVFDVDTVGGAPYIVMQYLEGRTLASLLETNGPLAPTLTADYALQACEALAEAHALGIVHRDLKPSNLFLARAPGGRHTLRVLDFGISKAFDVDRGESSFDATEPVGPYREVSTFSGTDSHAFIGSPPYVSPEQLVRPREADARSDIWSLGVVLYQCLTARLPFQGETLTRLWDAIVREPMPPLGATGGGSSPALERVIARCLEKDPALRYPDVRELARELAPLGSARARASLEVIDGLAMEEPRALPRASEAKTCDTAPESNRTLTEAPTTREPTPNVSMASSNRPWSRARVAVTAAALSPLVIALFLAFLPEHRHEPLARAAALAAPRAVLAAASRAPTTSELPPEKPAATVASEGLPPSPDAGARAPKPRRERTSALAPSRSASSRSEPGPVDVVARAEELLGKGHISEACAMGQVAAASTPDSPRVLEFLGRCHMRLGWVDSARSYYEQYLALAPSASNAAFVRAILERRAR